MPLYLGAGIGLLLVGVAIYLVLVNPSVQHAAVSAVVAVCGLGIESASWYYYRQAQGPVRGKLIVSEDALELDTESRATKGRIRWEGSNCLVRVVDDRQIGAASKRRGLPRGIYVSLPGKPGVPIPPEAYDLLVRVAGNHGLEVTHKRIPNPRFLGGGFSDLVEIQRPEPRYRFGPQPSWSTALALIADPHRPRASFMKASRPPPPAPPS